jgi:hypothetical protein
MTEIPKRPAPGDPIHFRRRNRISVGSHSASAAARNIVRSVHPKLAFVMTGMNAPRSGSNARPVLPDAYPDGGNRRRNISAEKCLGSLLATFAPTSRSERKRLRRCHLALSPRPAEEPAALARD